MTVKLINHKKFMGIWNSDLYHEKNTKDNMRKFPCMAVLYCTTLWNFSYPWFFVTNHMLSITSETENLIGIMRIFEEKKKVLAMRRRQRTEGSINAIFYFLSPTICNPSGSESLGIYTLSNSYNELKSLQLIVRMKTKDKGMY